jgi:hypothetical protein
MRGGAWGGKWWRRGGGAGNRIGGEEPRGGRVYGRSLRFTVIFFFNWVGYGLIGFMGFSFWFLMFN